jgi:ferredoxin
MSRDIRIDRDLCMGSGQCCMTAPQTFALDDDTIAVVVDPHGDADDVVWRASQGCPTNAITVLDLPSRTFTPHDAEGATDAGRVDS